MKLLFWAILSITLILLCIVFYFTHNLGPSLQSISDSLRGGSESAKKEFEKDKKKLNVVVWTIFVIMVIMFSYAGYLVYLKFHEPPQPPSCASGIDC